MNNVQKNLAVSPNGFLTTKMPEPSRGLRLHAQTWRTLMGLGMIFHRIPSGPHCTTYAFTQTVLATVSKRKGSFDLLFYTPKDYKKRKPGQTYPVVVNFHGGGFTIGAAHDDSRWADAVVHKVGAVVVNVEYRLAPEHPFPTAVEDGADAVLYLIDNAERLGLDPTRIGISGFSAGGNMAFTVPLRLQEEFRRRRDGIYRKGSITLHRDDWRRKAVGEIKVIMAWYPPTDYATRTRKERKATNVRQDKSLPDFFTDLFDSAYLPKTRDELQNPYLSPGLAPDEMLNALPADIIMYICEWDELRAEAEIFGDRLRGLEGKRVRHRIIAGAMHGFDKDPNPLWRDQVTENLYVDACVELRRALVDEAGDAGAMPGGLQVGGANSKAASQTELVKREGELRVEMRPSLPRGKTVI